MVILFGLPVHMCSKIGQNPAAPPLSEPRSDLWTLLLIAALGSLAWVLHKSDEWYFSWKQRREQAAYLEIKRKRHASEVDKILLADPDIGVCGQIALWADRLLVTEDQLLNALNRVGEKVRDVRRVLER